MRSYPAYTSGYPVQLQHGGSLPSCVTRIAAVRHAAAGASPIFSPCGFRCRPPLAPHGPVKMPAGRRTKAHLIHPSARLRARATRTPRCRSRSSGCPRRRACRTAAAAATVRALHCRRWMDPHAARSSPRLPSVSDGASEGRTRALATGDRRSTGDRLATSTRRLGASPRRKEEGDVRRWEEGGGSFAAVNEPTDASFVGRVHWHWRHARCSSKRRVRKSPDGSEVLLRAAHTFVRSIVNPQSTR